jgi:hypothetical protein
VRLAARALSTTAIVIAFAVGGCAAEVPSATVSDTGPLTRVDGGTRGGIDTGLGAFADGARMDLGAPAFDGATCGSTHFDIAPTPPNVLILLDRSCSMMQTPSGMRATPTSGTSKWSIATQTIHALTNTYAGLVRWGLIYLPRSGTMADGVMCGGTPVCGGTTSCPEVSPAVGTGPRIDTVLGSISPFSGCPTHTQVAITPLDDGIRAAGQVPELHDASRSDVVLLVTDGEETCVSSSQLVQDVRTLRAAGIHTAVVGFGAAGSGGVNTNELNAVATAGGLPSSGATQYYAAMDAASLMTAFDTIIGATLSCTFALGTAPASPSLLHVFVDASIELPNDPTHTNGWDYDAATTSITLYGSACADLRALRDSQLDVIQACASGVVPPPVQCQHRGGPCTSDADCCNLEGLMCDPTSSTCSVPAPP